MYSMDVVLRALKLVWIDFLYYCGLKLMYVFAMWNYSTTTWRAQFENFWISIVLRLHNDQHWRSTAKCAIGICFDIQNWFIIAWPELRCLERERSVAKDPGVHLGLGTNTRETLCQKLGTWWIKWISWSNWIQRWYCTRRIIHRVTWGPLRFRRHGFGNCCWTRLSCSYTVYSGNYNYGTNYA